MRGLANNEETPMPALDLPPWEDTPQAPPIVCPRCGQQIKLDEALRHRLAADLIAGREIELRAKADHEAAKRIRAALEEQTAKLEERDERLSELTGQLKEHQAAEKQLRRKQRELEDQKEAWDLERERMRDEIRKEEREHATKTQQERYEEEARRRDADHKTEVRQLKDKIERMNSKLEEAVHRGATGARQEEGLARQDVFAAELQARFPDDDILVTRRGQAGADVAQQVRHAGRECGTILWECKRTVSWNGTWVGKLSANTRKVGAALGVIVSETLPPGVEGSGRDGEVWICDFPSAVHLAAGLRLVLVAASQYEAANAARSDTSGRVYDYIATGGFASRCEAISRVVETMTTTLGRERRYYEQKWKEWERLIENVAGGVYGIADDLVGLGAEIPPPLRAELPQLVLPAISAS
jgi:hypothetical protein